MTSLNPVFTCGAQVMEAVQQHSRLSQKEARNKTLELFEKVRLPHPSQLFSRYPHQLSGGQKQRVMIAMAMSGNPRLLICDEPTTALDVTVQQTILELLKTLQAETGMGILFITHDLGVVADLADRVIVMYKGRILEQGPVRQIFRAPGHPYTKGLLACRPALHPKGQPLPVVADYWSDTSDTHLPQAAAPVYSAPKYDIETSGETLLSVRKLSVWFPGNQKWWGKPPEPVKAVDEVSFDLFRGETLGVVGESGCGKTTLGRALLRLIEPTGGSILYRGVNLLEQPPGALRRLRREFQIVFQDPYSSLNPRFTVGQAIGEPLQVHGIVHSRKERIQRVASLLEKVGLPPAFMQRYPHECSGGQRQRVAIARALALNPSFLVCDESVSALDVSVQAQVLNLLNQLKKDLGFTVLFISHDLSVVHYLSDRILVMHKGQIAESGSAAAIYHHPQREYTKTLLASLPGSRLAQGDVPQKD